MNISKDSLSNLADKFFDSNTSLEMLTMYNAGLSDGSIHALVNGIEKARSLVYLDLRRNFFESERENEGYSALIKAITAHKKLLTLRINSISIKTEEGLKSFKDLFRSR
jgi:Ran GTPase-activating protein (RanGAP) involved in mRNA processing and transport